MFDDYRCSWPSTRLSKMTSLASSGLSLIKLDLIFAASSSNVFRFLISYGLLAASIALESIYLTRACSHGAESRRSWISWLFCRASLKRISERCSCQVTNTGSFLTWHHLSPLFEQEYNLSYTDMLRAVETGMVCSFLSVQSNSWSPVETTQDFPWLAQNMNEMSAGCGAQEISQGHWARCMDPLAKQRFFEQIGICWLVFHIMFFGSFCEAILCVRLGVYSIRSSPFRGTKEYWKILNERRHQ